jgi:hypothetical protein
MFVITAATEIKFSKSKWFIRPLKICVQIAAIVSIFMFAYLQTTADESLVGTGGTAPSMLEQGEVIGQFIIICVCGFMGRSQGIFGGQMVAWVINTVWYIVMLIYKTLDSTATFTMTTISSFYTFITSLPDLMRKAWDILGEAPDELGPWGGGGGGYKLKARSMRRVRKKKKGGRRHTARNKGVRQ